MGKLFLLVLEIMLALFLFIVPGYVLKKVKLISASAISPLVAILLYVCQPMITLSPFVGPDAVQYTNLSMLALIGIAFLMALGGQIIAFFIARLALLKWPNRENADIYTFLTIFSNCGYVGIPFIKMLTEKMGIESGLVVLFAVVYTISFNMLVWTLGVYILTKDRSAMNIRKVFINPSVIPLIIAIPIFFFPQINIFNMLEPLGEVVELLGSMSAPLSMFIVGIRLADMKPKEIFGEGGVYVGAALRLFAAPLALFLIAFGLSFLPFFTSERMIALSIPVMLLGMPPAATLIAFCEKFERNCEHSTKAFLVATLLALITTPLLAMLAGAVGLL